MHGVNDIKTNNNINFTGCNKLKTFAHKIQARRYAQANQDYINKIRKQVLSKDAYNTIRFNQIFSSMIDQLKSFGILK